MTRAAPFTRPSGGWRPAVASAVENLNAPPRSPYWRARGSSRCPRTTRGGHHGTGVEAWEWLTSDPERRAAYKRARGKGGFVRCDWREVTELVAAAQVHTVKRHGPDRIVGFSPIPAMSYGDHTRFADDWLAAAPGTDGALAMAMGHVVLTEFHRDRRVPRFTEYAKGVDPLLSLHGSPGPRRWR